MPEPKLVLVPERCAVLVNGEEVRVTRTQFRLLSLLVANPGRVFRRAELVAEAIGARITERGRAI
jgi:two-component system response regulator CpxR